MMCYSANGPRIRFYAANADSKDADPFLLLTDLLDITNIINRFEVLKVVINIMRVLVTVKGLLPALPYPLAKRITIGTSEITYNFDHVKKRINITDLPYVGRNPQSRINFLKRMYEYAKRGRGLVHVKSGPKLEKKSNYVVRLATKGIRRQPHEEEELQRMTKDLVSGLALLHKGNFLHCDVRFPNILYNPVAGQYFLIDFEHGRQAEEGGVIHNGDLLKDWDGRTLENGRYTKRSEIYQLGKLLIKEFSFIEISDDGMDFIEMMERRRMTADELLQHPWIQTVP